MAFTPDQNDKLREASSVFGEEIKRREKKQETAENRAFLQAISTQVATLLTQFASEISKSVTFSKKEVADMVKGIKVEVPKIATPKIPNVNVPEATVKVEIPEIVVPTPEVTVNVPEIKQPKIPPIKVPKPEVTVNVKAPKIPKIEVPTPVVELPDNLSVMLNGVTREMPLPVMMMDIDGKPMRFPVAIGGGGGGGARITKVGEIDETKSTFIHGSLSAISTTTATQITDRSEIGIKGVLIKAAIDNTRTIYVGIGSGVTAGTVDATDGFELSAGGSLEVEVDDPSKVFVISGGPVFTQKAYWCSL